MPGQPTDEKFWQGLAFTRVIKTRVEEFQLRGYLKANRIQAARGEKAREEYLAKFNEWVRQMRSSVVSSA
ncbi:MAG: hypothetical protein JSU04_08170 [Bdellovibrionales bacterium]|nr:hypothetical protein [Bdellovibrionales bacterium]